MKGTTTAYIALGSNLGNREANLRRALAMLIETPQIHIRRISSWVETTAVGGPEDSPAFLNAAVEAQVSLTPQALMTRLLEIEQQMGRIRRTKWEPRIIDMDLLLFGNAIISSQDLIVPHPLMHERAFVLKPLAEIAPNAVHPALNATVAGLLESLNHTERHIA